MKKTDEDQQDNEIGLSSNHFEPAQGDAVSLKRRAAILRIAQKVSYAAPATLALLSVKASACSLTC